MRKLFKKFFIDNTDSSLIQFVRYFFVGGIAAIVNIGSLSLFVELFKINYIISNILAFILGLLVNYILSKRIVFTHDTSINRGIEIMMYVIIGVLGLGFDTLILWIFTSKFKFYYMLSKIISTMLTFIWNFFARKILYIKIDGERYL